MEIIGQFRVQILFVAVVYIFVFLSVCLDLWAGTRKAKMRGEYRSSFKLRQTVEKICRYYNMMFLITAIDCIQMFAIYLLHEQGSIGIMPVFPLFTCIASMFVGFIELKSVWEKNEDKEKAKITEAAKFLLNIAQSDDQKEMLTKIIEIASKGSTKPKG